MLLLLFWQSTFFFSTGSSTYHFTLKKSSQKVQKGRCIKTQFYMHKRNFTCIKNKFRLCALCLCMRVHFQLVDIGHGCMHCCYADCCSTWPQWWYDDEADEEVKQVKERGLLSYLVCNQCVHYKVLYVFIALQSIRHCMILVVERLAHNIFNHSPSL